jgi:methionine synthase / methylenetetrahydrofolate reductase (NADH)
MSVLATALLVRDGTGLDVNMHFTCRDRTLMGIQADLLGAHALDIRNILAMTGDPPRASDYTNATAVFDVEGVGLIEAIGDPTSFCIGAALNPGAEDVDREIERFRRKLQAGARWGANPACERPGPARPLPRAGRRLAGAGARRRPALAQLPARQVPAQRSAGHHHPRRSRVRLREAGARALRAGIELAQSLVHAVRRRYAGAYLMPSFGRFEVVTEVLDVIH